ncbi:MAG: hypothetical protein M1343_02630 [Chloroflexi bacterium]|nr:hypothetical protein [Chloroflexota bacterium]MDA8189334.1 hypothetical protein [Dehalococcoidales bacterium]
MRRRLADVTNEGPPRRSHNNFQLWTLCHVDASTAGSTGAARRRCGTARMIDLYAEYKQ